MKIQNRTTQRLLKVMSERNLTVEEAMTSLLVSEEYMTDNEISPLVDFLQMSAITSKMSKLVSRVRAKNALILDKPKVVLALNNKEHYYEVINAVSVKYKNAEYIKDVNVSGVDDYQGIYGLKHKEAAVIAVYDLSIFGEEQPATNGLIGNILARGMVLFIAKTGQVIRNDGDRMTIVSKHFKALSEASE